MLSVTAIVWYTHGNIYQIPKLATIDAFQDHLTQCYYRFEKAYVCYNHFK